MQTNSKSRARPKTSMNRFGSAPKQQKLMTVGLDFGKHTDLYAGVYQGNDINQSNLLPSFKSCQISQESNKRIQGIYKNMKINVRNSRTIEEVQQQNNQVKKQNNKLKHQILIMKGKLSKKNINAPDCTYVSNQRTVYGELDAKSHRILAMRQQYQNYRTKFQQQRKQLQQTKKKLFCSGLPQMQAYLNQVVAENKRLKKIIAKSTNTLTNTENKQPKAFRSVGKGNLALNSNKQYIAGCVSNQLSILKDKIRNLELKLKEKDKKLQQHQKSLIKRDNKEHSVKKQISRIQKQRQNTISEYNSLRNEAITEIKKYNIQIVRLKGKHQWELQSLKKQHEKQLLMKDKQIQDMIQANRKFKEETNRSKAGSQYYYKTDLGLRQASRKASMDFMNLNLLNTKNPKSDYIKVHTQKNQIIYFANIDGLQLQPREPKSANVNHFADSPKLKLMQLHQIKQIGQLLYYRILSYQIKPSQLKQYFDFKMPEEQNHEKLEKESEKSSIFYSEIKNNNFQFEKEYITMKQTRDKLMAHPFSLNDQQSFMLARYLIQDSEDGYVYCHELNENKREIVKSILRAVIGEWKLKDLLHLQQMNCVLKQNKQNIKRLIQTYFCDGFLTRNQLTTILKSTDIGTNKQFVQYLIMKMSQFSVSLQKLNSKQFFQILPS